MGLPSGISFIGCGVRCAPGACRCAADVVSGQAQETPRVAVAQCGSLAGIGQCVFDAQGGLRVVEIEGIVGADHELAGAEAVHQVSERRLVEDQRVVEEPARGLRG